MAEFHSLVKEQPQSVVDLKLGPNLGGVLHGKRDVAVQETPLPILQPDGVLVQVMATGICGSDMHSYLEGGIGPFRHKEPVVMGHESAGQVIAVGSMVKTHKVGDRVAIEPALPCRRCTSCKNGKLNLCRELKYCGAPGGIGTISRYFALPADMAPHLPEHLTWEEAGCVQPLAVSIQIAKRAGLGPHDTVFILGCGPVGLLAAAVAEAYSAKLIVGVDNNPARVAFAKTYVSPVTGKPIFDHVFLNPGLPEVLETNGAPAGDYHPTEGDTKFQLALKQALLWTGQAGVADEGGFDRIIEASGAAECMLLGVAAARPGGTYTAVGLTHQVTYDFPTLMMTMKDLDVRGLARYTASCFPAAIDLLARRVVDVKQLITSTFPLADTAEAFETVARGKDIKVVIMNSA